MVRTGATDVRFAHFSRWADADSLAQPRRAFPRSRRPSRQGPQRWAVRRRRKRFPAGVRVRVWLDALYRPDFSWRPGHGRDERDNISRRFHARRTLGWLGYPVSANGPGHQSIPWVLSTVPPPLARRRGW